MGFFFFLVTELNNRCRPAFPGLKLTDEGGECKLSRDVSFKWICSHLTLVLILLSKTFCEIQDINYNVGMQRENIPD